MTTAFQTGPGFYAAFTDAKNNRVPRWRMRLYHARLEAYDIPLGSDPLSEVTSFHLLVAQAQGNPEIAFALLELAKAIEANRAHLEAEAGKP